MESIGIFFLLRLKMFFLSFLTNLSLVHIKFVLMKTKSIHNILRAIKSDVHSKFLAKIENSWNPSINSPKNSILDVWLGSECTFVSIVFKSWFFFFSFLLFLELKVLAKEVNHILLIDHETNRWKFILNLRKSAKNSLEKRKS